MVQVKRRRLFLTGKFFSLFAIIQVVGVSAVLLSELVWLYLAALVLLIIAAGFDYKSWSSLSQFLVSLKIPRLPVIKELYEIQIRVVPARSAKKLRFSWLGIALEPSSRLAWSLKFTALDWEDSETESPSLQVQIPAQAIRLGYEQIDHVQIAVRSAQKFWIERAQVSLEKPAEFRVMPPSKKIGEQSFRVLAKNQMLFLSGSRQLLRSQEPEQFHSIRPYQFPDPIRYIDPFKSARYQKLMTRSYDSHFSQHLIVALDLGRSSAGHLGQSKKLDYYLGASLALIENAIQSRDRVSFIGFSQKVHALVRAARSSHPFHFVFQGRGGLAAYDVESNYDLLIPTLDQIESKRSVLLILTDAARPSVQEELMRLVPQLSRRHLTVVAGIVDEKLDIQTQLQDPEIQKLSQDNTYSQLLYGYWLNERARHFGVKMSRMGAGSMLVTNKDWMESTIKLYQVLRRSISL